MKTLVGTPDPAPPWGTFNAFNVTPSPNSVTTAAAVIVASPNANATQPGIVWCWIPWTRAD